MPTAFQVRIATRPLQRQPEARRLRTPADEARPSLKTVLEAIRLDCMDQPDRYLDEIFVPLGGE